MNEEKSYAPVIIPTLCRYDTFMKCINSLAFCTGAENTELYIGLDYPSKESHWDGYNKIKAIIHNIQGFKQVHVYERESNYGAAKNFHELRKIVIQKYDTYIYSEDDNEFSPNFLEYINKGLVKYRDNPNVVAICGFSYPFTYMTHISGYPFNAFPIAFYNAWGTGYWVDKRPDEYINSKKAKDVVFSWKEVLRLWRKGHFITVHRLLYRYEFAYGDLMWRVYCANESKYTIFPVISKVRNWGFDENNSTNCQTIDLYSRAIIDEDSKFEFDQFEIKNYKSIQKVRRKLTGGNLVFRIVSVCEYISFRFGGKPLREYSLFKKILIFRVKHVGVNN